MENSWYNINLDKGGRPPIAPATPDVLWEKFVEYVQWCIDNPILDPRTGARMPQALSWQNFMAFLGVGYRPRQYKDYYGKKEGFSAVITRIENIIEGNQLNGALAGVYTPNIVARLNGYTDKTETENKHEVSGAFLWKEIE